MILSACYQVQLRGPVATSAVAITELDSGTEIHSGTSWDEEFVIDINGSETWDGYESLVRLALLGIYLPNTESLDDAAYYLVSANGGRDSDFNSDLQYDVDAGAVTGTWRAIMRGADARKRGPKVSALTEAIYQYLAPNLDNLSPADLESQLNLLARRTVDDVNEDGVVDYYDALLWSRLFDADKLLASEELLNDLSDAIAAGDSDIYGLAVNLVESGADYDGEWVYRFSRPDGNSYTCAHCHAVVEPASNGYARPGHPLGDASARVDYKNGQVSSLREAANSCLDEWMNAGTWSNANADWLKLEDWLSQHAPPETAESVDIQIAAVPAILTGGDASAGRETFNSSCAICHAQDGEGSLQAPAIGGFGYDSNYVANRVRNSGRSDSQVYDGLTGGIMPFWGANRFSDAELLNVVAFLELGEDDLEAITGDTGNNTGGSGCASDHEKVGWVAELTTRQHQVSGTATIIDNCTIEVTQFNYDGRGIVVQAYTGQGRNFNSRAAHAISENLVGTAFADATVQFSLPDDLSLDEFGALSIWCVEVGVSFGDGIFAAP
jgi:mono/diheme cytochrome c family protein